MDDEIMRLRAANDRLVAMVNELSPYIALATKERDDALARLAAAEALVGRSADSENVRLQAALNAAKAENDRLAAMVNALNGYLATVTRERDEALTGRAIRRGHDSVCRFAAGRGACNCGAEKNPQRLPG
jgi:hypothetical protein